MNILRRIADLIKKIPDLLKKIPDKFPKSLGARLAIIGVPIIVILLVVIFAVDFFGIRSLFSRGRQVAQTEGAPVAETPSVVQQLDQSREVERVSEQVEKEALALALQKMALDAERKELDQKITEFQKEKDLLEKDQLGIQTQQEDIKIRADELDRRRKAIDEKEQELIQREQIVLLREQEQEKAKPLPPQEESEAERLARERRLKKLAKDFSTMRPKDAANLLLEMLNRGDEGKAYVLNLLQNTDSDTRTRIMSAIAKIQVDTAAELTQMLIVR